MPAKKPTKAKGRKTSNEKIRRPQRVSEARVENSALSVVDGAMKDVIRSAFLRRDR